MVFGLGQLLGGASALAGALLEDADGVVVVAVAEERQVA
jgi:hypothetical protein